MTNFPSSLKVKLERNQDRETISPNMSTIVALMRLLLPIKNGYSSSYDLLRHFNRPVRSSSNLCFRVVVSCFGGFETHLLREGLDLLDDKLG